MIYVLITISELRLPAPAILCGRSSHLNDCWNIITKFRIFVKYFFRTLPPPVDFTFPFCQGAGMENEYAKSIPPPGKVHLFCGVCFCSSLTLLKNLTNTYKNYISKLYITVCKTLQPVPDTRGVWQVLQYVWGVRQLNDRARSVR